MLALFLAPAIGHYIPVVARSALDADGHQICLVWTDSGFGHSYELVSASRLARDGSDSGVFTGAEREWRGGWIAGVSERT